MAIAASYFDHVNLAFKKYGLGFFGSKRGTIDYFWRRTDKKI